MHLVDAVETTLFQLAASGPARASARGRPCLAGPNRLLPCPPRGPCRQELAPRCPRRPRRPPFRYCQLKRLGRGQSQAAQGAPAAAGSDLLLRVVGVDLLARRTSRSVQAHRTSLPGGDGCVLVRGPSGYGYVLNAGQGPASDTTPAMAETAAASHPEATISYTLTHV